MRSTLTIDLEAICHNIDELQKQALTPAAVMPILKANGYGTDAQRIAETLSKKGCPLIGIATVEEGVAIRSAGIQTPLFLLAAHPDEWEALLAYDLQVSINDTQTLQAFNSRAEKLGKTLQAHLHIDTGLSRLGIPFDKLEGWLPLWKQCNHVKMVGVYTHFAAADKPHHDLFSYEQINRFDQALDQLEAAHLTPRWIHAANSTAALRFALPRCNLMRAGMALYGQGAPLNGAFCPALCWTSKIVGFSHCRKGETVGYHRQYQPTTDRKLAVLGIGYYDGLIRQYTPGAHVLIRGQKAPIVGSVCMDFSFADVTDIEGVSLLDEAIIIGQIDDEKITLDNWAQWGNTNPREVICSIGPRVHRQVIQRKDPKTQRKKIKTG